jgi:uncharacterized protein YggE
MKRFAPLLIALVMLAAALPAAAQTTEPAFPTLTVTGTGTVERTPDRASISFSLVTNDASNTRALSENNAKYNAVTAALAKFGITEKSLRTTSFSSQFYPRPAKPDPSLQTRYGYVVTRSVVAETSDLTSVGPIVDAITTSSAADINPVSYDLKNPNEAQRAAQSAAVEDAVLQAHNLASAAGVRLMRIIRIGNDTGGYQPVRTFGLAMAKAAGPAEVPTVLLPSPLEISASVTMTYEIAPAVH